MASSLVNRLKLSALAGFGFLGKRDLYKVFGYPQILTFDQLYIKYQRQDLAGRVVDMPPEETWARSPNVILPASSQAFKDFAIKLSLWNKIIQADKLCAFGPFSVLWVGLPGAQNTPAKKKIALDDILYLQAYGGDSVRVKSYEDNPNNERFGRPVIYEVVIGPKEAKNTTIEVHHTRIIHIVDRPLQGSIFAEPRLSQIYNTLEDLQKVGGGSAELYWLTANRGIQIDVDKEMELSELDAAALSDEVDEYQHELRRVLRTRGVKVTTLGSEVADPRGVHQILMAVLAGATSIPQRILTGSEAGQLASEQDRANWATYIERRRKVFAEPYVLLPILLKLEELGLLQGEEAIKATYEWTEAFQTNPIEEAAIRANDGRSLVNYSRRNQFNNPIITDEEVRRKLKLPDKPPAGETLPAAPPSTGNTKGTGTSEDPNKVSEPPEEAV